MAGKKKKKAAVPPGLVRGYATQSIQKVKVVPEPELVPETAAPAPEAEVTAPSVSESRVDNEEDDTGFESVATATKDSAEQDGRLAVLKVEAETLRVDRRRNALAKNAAVPLIKLSDVSEKEIMNFVQEQRALESTDWFATESNEATSRVKLQTTYLTLEKIGFAPLAIEHAMEAVGGQNIPRILDWLPTGFTDKIDHVEESAKKLAKLAAEHEKQKNLPAVQEDVKVPTPPSRSTTAGAGKSDQDMKNWILNTTWDDSESESEGAEDDKFANEPPTERYARLFLDLEEKKYQAAVAKAGGDTDKQKELEKSMRGVRNGLKQAASQKKYKADQAQKIIDANKVNRPPIPTVAKVAPVEARESTLKTPASASDTEIDMLPDLNALFDESPPDTSSALPKAALRTRILSLPIASNWTGKTPKQLLQEWVSRKSRGTNIKYYRIQDQTAGLRAGVCFTGGTGKVIENGMCIEMDPADRVEKWKEGEECAAAVALYALASDLPLNRSLPPAFRDLWLEWVARDKNASMEEQSAFDARRVAFVDSFVNVRNARLKLYQRTDGSDDSLDVSREPMPETGYPTFLGNVDPDALQLKMNQRLQSGPYRRLLNQRQGLPVYAMRASIMDVIRQHRVIVVSGETGSGKSTQIPQFIVEDAIARGDASCRVVCTQPRRISAISIASRVSEELGDLPGRVGYDDSWVGYQVRLENRVGRETLLTFCTIGILLKRLESDNGLRDVTHVVVDEVHERSLDSDFLILCLKRLLQRRGDLTIILMSATADADRFATYFERIPGVGNVPCLHVPGRTFPVVTHFLEDAIEATGFVVEGGDRDNNVRDAGFVNVSAGGGKMHKVRVQWDSEAVGSRNHRSVNKQGGDFNEDDNDDDDEDDEEDLDENVDPTTSSWQATTDMVDRSYSSATLRTLDLINPRRINFDLLDTLIRYVCDGNMQMDEGSRGSVLVFLPGIGEIKTMLDRLAGQRGLWVLSLHSSLGTGDQGKVFQSVPPGQTKVVLATNIAETGITIPDVTVVIDTMRAREVQFDRKRNVTRLTEVLVSKANALQRRGRAGRVREGVCWHLVDREQWDRVASYRPPEMVRVPLDEVCLRVRACGFEGTVGAILNGCVDSPPEKNVERAIERLKMIQAFTPDEQLTPLGRKLSHLPLDTRLGKMLLTAAALRCLDPVLTICAVISCGKSLFLSGASGDRWREFVWGASDLMMAAKAFDAYRAIDAPFRIRRAWCEKKELSFEVMGFVEETRTQIIKALLDCRVVSKRTLDSSKVRGIAVDPLFNTHADNPDVVATAIAAGVYPNVFIMHPAPTVAGRTDTTPVTLHAPGHATPLYRLHKTSALIKTLSPAGVKELAGCTWGVAYAVRAGNIGFNTMACWDYTSVPPVALWCLAGPHIEVQHRLGTLEAQSTPSSSLSSSTSATAPSFTTRCAPRSATALCVLAKAVRAVIGRRLVADDAGGDKEGVQKDERIMDLFLRVMAG
ncbi:hypothetical protein PhCBS80983_g05892 [Powellomyces hirtus]|uniref:RNA helicase n=1 Tax=Powellomyces hirtus TaxID=109895 RepID=A0A507DTC1_9FUNG|nr:hypothetical protein PhCBS80983_g05892 [Powellomyces hirtus]